MKWDFLEDGKYESHFRIDDFAATSVENVVTQLHILLPDLLPVLRDPLLDYLRMHRDAALSLSSQRGKNAFVQSAERRVKRWGQGVLLSLQRERVDARLVVTSHWVSVLGSPATTRDCVRPFGEQISQELGGTLTEIIY